MRLRNTSADFMMFANLFFRHEYRFMPPADGNLLAVDIGAHIGCAGCMMMAVGYRNILAVEPDPQSLALAQENLAEFGAPLGAKSRTVLGAVAPPGAKLARFTGTGHFQAAIPDPAGDIPALELATLFTEPVGLVKVDIEGAEFELIRWTPEEVLRRPLIWVVECHQWVGDWKEIAKLFEDIGYKTAIDENFAEDSSARHLTAIRE